MHDRKILHRDLKSQNIFLTKNGIVKLGDFGIAKVLSHTKENLQTIVGTPFYLSPEIVENRPYNYKSDIWSLGILLYEMCCLEPPFNGSSLHSLALNIVRGAYNPIPKKYSSKLSLLLKKLLNPNTEERPTINKILKIDIIADRAKQLLNESEYIQEFSHTVLHDKNIFKQTNYAQESSKPAKVSRAKSNLQEPGYDAAMNSGKDKALIGGEKRKKTIKKSQSETVEMTETERYEQNPMDYVNNVLGDLRQKLSLDDSEAAKPTREVRAGIRKPKPSGPSAISGAKKASQWEIREEIAKKKREEIMQEVRRKREREEEMKVRAERK